MSETKSRHRKLTQAELVTEAQQRFGDNPLDWAFTCPSCGITSNGHDFGKALKEHPRKTRKGVDVIVSDLIGQECIGRTDPDKGCNWAAYGLFRGPWEIVMPDGHSVWGFPLAEVGEGQTP